MAEVLSGGQRKEVIRLLQKSINQRVVLSRGQRKVAINSAVIVINNF